MIAVVDYGMGNLGSVLNMLARIGVQASRASTPAQVAEADALIIPGVGAFDSGMRALEERLMIEPIRARVERDGIPILGLCLGMQLFARGSEEGTAQGFGWLDATVVRFTAPAEAPALKVPHMGWAQLDVRRAHPILRRARPESRYYFAHSYYMRCNEEQDVLATATYGEIRFPALVGRGNVVGLQCHPEKSHRFGMDVLRDFAAMAGA